MTSTVALVIYASHQWFLSYPNIEKFYLTLTISGNGASISGTAVGAEVDGTLPGTYNIGDTWYSFSFSGSRI